MLGVSTAQIIKTLMGLGEMATITQSLSDEAIELIAADLERKVTIVHAEEEAERPEEFDDADGGPGRARPGRRGDGPR